MPSSDSETIPGNTGRTPGAGAARNAATLAGAVVALLSVAVPAQASSAPLAAHGTGVKISRIASASQHTCLDVRTTDVNVDLYGSPCNGSAAQSFAFHRLTGAPTGTFEIVSRSSTNCLNQYRFGVRQQSCTGSVPPDASNVQWTLQQVGTTGRRYRFVSTSTLGSASPRCIQVYPKPSGYPGPLFELTACSSDPAQVLTIDTSL